MDETGCEEVGGGGFVGVVEVIEATLVGVAEALTTG
jgi:hypothetical protein